MKSKWVKMISIIGVGLILVGVLAFQTSMVGNAKNEAKELAGSWKVTITGDGAPPITSEANFSNDGTITMIEDNGTVGIGVWEKLSGDQYAFTVWEYIEQGGSNFQAKVSSTITLDDKDLYSGPFFFQFMDLDGHVLASGTGTSVGVRNHVEPMPN
jgi:hypothetical protein